MPLGQGQGEVQLTLGEQVQEAGQTMIAATRQDVGAVLVAQLQQIFGPPFRIEGGLIADSSGARTAPFGALICIGGQPIGDAGDQAVVPTESVAAVFDVTHTLDLDKLVAAYVRVASAKAMVKTAPAPGNEVIEPTLGVIFAIDTEVPLEDLAAELERLNKDTPSAHWPDLVVVAAKGMISYMVQWLGETTLNSLLPPSPGVMFVAPMYVVMMMSASGVGTFNILTHLLLGQLGRWSRGYVIQGSDTIMDGVSRTGINFTGYQYNLANELKPVPREQYRDRTMPLKSFALVPHGKKDALAAIAFVSWQDGGVIILKGKLPLGGLLVFMAGLVPDQVLRKSQVINLEGSLQLSSVMPIGPRQFHLFLANIRKRGGMNIVSNDQKFVVKKFADEGSSSPFIARVVVAPIQMAGSLVNRDNFVMAHNSLITTLMEIRESVKDVAKTWHEYARKIDDGSIVERDASGNIRVAESVDRPLRRLVNEFLSGATRSFKERMQQAARTLGLDIGCLYQKEAKFEAGLAALENVDRPLADYLREARRWSDLLVTTRNNLDHGDWSLPDVVIAETNGRIAAAEPSINGTPVTEWVAEMFDRVISFVEDVLAHGVQKSLDGGIALCEIPRSERDANMPVRFQNTILDGGRPAWGIRYHVEKFDQT